MPSSTAASRTLCSAVVLVLAVTLAPLHVKAGTDLEQHLRDQYNGKTLVLRNFYHGDRLSYDSGGMPAGSGVSGDWTVDGLARVTSLDLHGKKLTIQAQRLSLGNTGKSFQFEQYFDKDNKKRDKKKEEKAKEGRRLRIEVDFDADEITVEKADAALSRIFLTAQDRFAQLVPDYWKPCVLSASTGRSIEPAATLGSSQNWKTLPTGGGQYDACSFPPEFAAIAGVVYSPEETGKPDEAPAVETSDGPIVRIGKGVTPPRAISQSMPEFSEQARSAKYQGTVVLSFVVDRVGLVRNIRVLRPLGFGLDRKAVETVSTWRFDPARKDGGPVAAEIVAEVDFHLY